MFFNTAEDIRAYVRDFIYPNIKGEPSSTDRHASRLEKCREFIEETPMWEDNSFSKQLKEFIEDTAEYIISPPYEKAYRKFKQVYDAAPPEPEEDFLETLFELGQRLPFKDYPDPYCNDVIRNIMYDELDRINH